MNLQVYKYAHCIIKVKLEQGFLCCIKEFRSLLLLTQGVSNYKWGGLFLKNALRTRLKS